MIEELGKPFLGFKSIYLASVSAYSNVKSEFNFYPSDRVIMLNEIEGG